MKYFQDNSQFIANTTLADSVQTIHARKQLTNLVLSIAQVIVGVALLVLSTHLAVESEIYLNSALVMEYFIEPICTMMKNLLRNQ